MPDRRQSDESPLFWPIAELRAAYRRGALSPVEVLEEAIARIDRFDPILHAFLARLDGPARSQARAAEAAYRQDNAGPLSGVPISIKDTFPVAGARTTFGSLVYKDNVTDADSGAVARLRRAGAVFVGKTNTAEFGQSATTDNLLGPDAANPWDPARTPGGSSGGAAASVAAGLATAALAADGGGSIRIPGAFTGLCGFKPTFGLVADDGSPPAMTAFVCPGPLTRCVADARALLAVLAETDYPRRPPPKPLRIAWCPRPEGRPVDPTLAAVVAEGVARLSELGHAVTEADLPIAGWNDAFAPLVLADEGRHRGHLLRTDAERLTDYERRSLEGALALGDADIERARAAHAAYGDRIEGLFESYDVLVTPATAVPAFPLGERPREIDGEAVTQLWGAAPFSAPFNVSGNPAAVVPCGLAGGLPVALHLVAAKRRDGLLLDLCEDLEEAVGFDAAALRARWRLSETAAEVAR